MPSFLPACRRRYAFTAKSITFSSGNRAQNRMKIKSKIFQFLFLCWQCIIWCWWVWRVSGNVSRVLQTRKTTKICVAFLIIHYNRDSNTNGHLLLFIIGASSLASWGHRTQIDLARKVLRVVQNRSNPVPSYIPSQTTAEESFWEQKQSPLIVR